MSCPWAAMAEIMAIILIGKVLKVPLKWIVYIRSAQLLAIRSKEIQNILTIGIHFEVFDSSRTFG